jgi:hypothetical protein
VLGEINVSSVFPIPAEAPAEIASRVADRLRSNLSCGKIPFPGRRALDASLLLSEHSCKCKRPPKSDPTFAETDRSLLPFVETPRIGAVVAFLLINFRFEPRLCEPQSPFPGNGILPAETKAPERRLRFRMALGRDDARTRKPANSALFAMNGEISVCARLRGGGRSRSRTGLTGPIPC